MSLELVRRGENLEADALADGRTEGFSPELRVGLDFSEIAWLVLHPVPWRLQKVVCVQLRCRWCFVREFAAQAREIAGQGVLVVTGL